MEAVLSENHLRVAKMVAANALFGGVGMAVAAGIGAITAEKAKVAGGAAIAAVLTAAFAAKLVEKHGAATTSWAALLAAGAAALVKTEGVVGEVAAAILGIAMAEIAKKIQGSSIVGSALCGAAAMLILKANTSLECALVSFFATGTAAGYLAAQ